MRCRVCQAENREGLKYCEKCNATLPRSQPTVSAQSVQPTQNQTEPKPRVFTVVFIIVIILVAVVVIGIIDSASSPKIKLTAYNQAWIDVRVSVSIDGEPMVTMDMEPRQTEVIGTWSVGSGSHLVEVNYAYPDIPPTDMGDPPEWTQEVKVGLFNTKNIYLVLA